MIFLMWLSNAQADAIIGGSDGISALAQIGTPWKQARIHMPLNETIGLVGEYQLATTSRHQLFLGINQLYLERKWRVTGDLFGGYINQTGELSQRGIAGELRLRTGKTKGKVKPWITLGTHHQLVRNQVIIKTQLGLETTIESFHVWSLTGSTGAAIPITENGDIILGLDLPWISIPTPSIPGAHIGFCWSMP
jgi:hypothetical protein